MANLSSPPSYGFDDHEELQEWATCVQTLADSSRRNNAVALEAYLAKHGAVHSSSGRSKDVFLCAVVNESIEAYRTLVTYQETQDRSR
ncbi:hypothetical protein PG994_000266 [Apiospora phragmitis]|uniref:PH domain-containing protein n=1 Tax=Apiospora phragmitis TaxID=2905665 RepID=A0ABR1X5S9_9PEZI